MKKIEKTAQINAPKEKVWNVLVNNDINHEWFAVFMAGTVANTDWQTGSRVSFTDPENNGIMGKIAENKPYSLVVIEYDGFLQEGKEDFDSDMAKAFAGTQEIYKLSDSDGGTRLDVSLDMSDDYYDAMSAQWDTAMVKIAELAESR